MKSEHEGAFEVCVSALGDNWQAYYATAEIAYWRETGQLPEWGLFIEQMSAQTNVGEVIVHRDTKAQD